MKKKFRKEDTVKIILNVLICVLVLASLVLLIWGVGRGIKNADRDYEDGIEQLDINRIFLKASKVEVNFSEVLLSSQNESRKLIVSEQTGSVSTELTDRLIKNWNVGFLTKTQTVSYEGKGYFVVDLDNISKDRIEQDSKAKKVTIYIDKPYLEAIEINPEDVVVGDVKGGFLYRGDIELTLADYNAVEKELRTRLQNAFNTDTNKKLAETNALSMVKAVFEPIVNAIDEKYEVEIIFK